MVDYITKPTHTDKKKTGSSGNVNSRLLMQGTGASEMRQGMPFFAHRGGVCQRLRGARIARGPDLRGCVGKGEKGWLRKWLEEATGSSRGGGGGERMRDTGDGALHAGEGSSPRCRCTGFVRRAVVGERGSGGGDMPDRAAAQGVNQYLSPPALRFTTLSREWRRARLT